MAQDLSSLIDRGQIFTLFQPIIDGATREAYGYEALSRGPLGSAWHTPAELFAAAGEHGRLLDLERACLRSALRAFRALGHEVKLFLNILPQTLLQWDTLTDWLGNELAANELDPHSLVLEITEHGIEQAESALAAAVARVRALGCDMAIDDLGTGVSGLKAWSAIRPEYVKVDRYFVAGIEQDPVRGEILRSVVEMGRATSSRIVAEGIENREQCAIVRELGIDYLQGYFFGRPAAVPRVEATEIETLPRLGSGATAECAEHLARPIPPVPAPTLVSQVVEMFRREPNCTALAVVENDRPIGLVRRDALLILYSKPLHPEIYGRKPVTHVMDKDAARIDARARLDQVSRLVTGQDESRQREDFIITRNGGYLGLGRTMDLLRQITTQQLQAARHSNPLTGLPGNREIHACLTQLIRRRQRFVACHLDLDNFKAFNDTYGYSRGDQVLLHVAQAITGNVRARVDFVGHLGGDDFVFFLRSQDWSLRLLEMLQDLNASLVNFHSAEHRDTGGYQALGREGVMTRHALLSVSVGAVENDSRELSAEAVGKHLRAAKALAKSQFGNSCVLISNERAIDLISQREFSELPLCDTTVMPALLDFSKIAAR